MAADFHFYSDAFNLLNQSLGSYVTDTSSNVIRQFTPVTSTLLSIYVCLWGWAAARGMINEYVTDTAQRMVRLSLVTSLAMGAGYYQGFIVDLLWNAPDELANVMTGGQGTSSISFLDVVMSRMYDFGDTFWDKAHASASLIPDLGLLITAMAIWTVGLAVTAYAAFLMFLSKTLLAVLLAIGPIFVLSLVFDAMKRFFESWLGQALNFVFLPALCAGVLKLILSILQLYLDKALPAAGDPSISMALPAIALSLIAALGLMQLPAVASALGGGVAVSTLGAVGGMLSRLRGAASATRPTNVRKAMRKAQADGRIAAQWGRQTAGAPLAVYRRITTPRSNRVSRTGT